MQKENKKNNLLKVKNKENIFDCIDSNVRECPCTKNKNGIKTGFQICKESNGITKWSECICTKRVLTTGDL